MIIKRVVQEATLYNVTGYKECNLCNRITLLTNPQSFVIHFRDKLPSSIRVLLACRYWLVLFPVSFYR